MIIWLNGGFGAGKTTLARELQQRLPQAVVYDPEHVGAMLWRWLPRNDDFQDLPSWRELVVAAALSLRRHHADTLLVPMSLLRDDYRDEILGALAAEGEQILHVFLHADARVLDRRLHARSGTTEHPGDDTELRWVLSRIDAGIAASTRQSRDTLVLRSDELTPEDLADRVIARANLRSA